MNNSDAACGRFNLWQLRCGRTLVHDGIHLRVCIRAPHVAFSVHLDNALTVDQPFAYVLPANQSLNETQRLITQFAALCANKKSGNRGYCIERPTRATLYHFRALQAFDGVASGASQREIASVLMGNEAVTSQWSTDSSLRAHVRALIDRGRRFVSGGYRALIGNNNQINQGAHP